MITNLKSNIGLSGFYVVYEGSTNLEKKRMVWDITFDGTPDVQKL